MTLSGISAIAQPMQRPFAKQAAEPSQLSPWTLVDQRMGDQRMGGASETAGSTMGNVLKPYFTLACVAFVVGFASYLALGWVMTPRAPAADDWQASISTPAAPVDAPLAQGKLI